MRLHDCRHGGGRCCSGDTCQCCVQLIKVLIKQPGCQRLWLRLGTECAIECVLGGERQ